MANGSAYRLAFVLCKSTGEPITELAGSSPASKRLLQRRRNVPGTATVTMPLESPAALALLPGLSRLKIYRSATPAELALSPSAATRLVWYGSLPAENVIDDVTANTCTAIFVDPRWVLARRQLQAPASYVAADQGTILWTHVAAENARQDTWLRQGTTTTGVVRTINYDRGKVVDSIITEMAGLTNGPDIDVGPFDGYAAAADRRMANFNVFATQGTDRPLLVYYVARETGGSGGGGNLIGLKRGYAPVINGATSVGTDAAGNASLQRFASLSGYDLQESFDTSSDALTAASLLERAQGVVAANQVPRVVFGTGRAVGDNAPLPLSDYDLGDTLRLSARVGRIQHDRISVRIEGYDLEADQEGNVLTTPIFSGAIA